MKKNKVSPARFMIGALMVFFAGAFILPAALQSQDTRLYTLAAVIPAAILLGSSKRLTRLLLQDRVVFVMTLVLCGMSILVRTLADIEAGLSLAFLCAGALILMVAGSLFVRLLSLKAVFVLIPVVPALTLLVLPLIMNVSPFRPGFVSVVLLMTAFVSLLCFRKEFPAMLMALAGSILLLAQRDLAAAAVWSVTFLLLFWAFSGHPLLLIAGAGATVLSAYLAGALLPGIYSPAGSSSFFTSVSPGWFGLELSDPFLADAATSDASAFSWIVVRYGWIFAGCVLMLCLLLVMRITSLARASRYRMHGMLAMGAALLTGLSSVAALLSDFGIWPAPGFSLPALTNDPVSVYAFLFLMGLAGGVSARSRADLDEDEHLAMLAD